MGSICLVAVRSEGPYLLAIHYPLNIILINLLVQRRTVNRNRHEPRRRRHAGGRFIARLSRSGLGHGVGRDVFGVVRGDVQT